MSGLRRRRLARETAAALAAGTVALALGCSADDASSALPGARGGACVQGDLCDYGLACVEGHCEPGPWGLPSATGGSSAGLADSGSDGAGAVSVGGAAGTGAAGTPSAGGSGGASGEGTGGVAGSSGGAQGSGGNGGSGGTGATGGSGGTGATGGSGGVGATGGSGGTSATGGSSGTGATGGAVMPCLGIPAARGRCNPAFCLCVATNECYAGFIAAVCCPTAPSC